jgi:enoyl-CoA hydratase
MAEPPVLQVHVVGHVLLLKLNRPTVRNAINESLALSLAQELDRLDDRPELRAGIITGDEAAFCSGMDLAEFSGGTSVPPGGHASWRRVLRDGSTKPLVAAVEGWAVAGGLELLLACDIVVASSDARFALPEVRRGLVPAGGTLHRLPRRIPDQVARELILTATFIDAQRALQVGLVNQLVAPGTALDRAIEIAQLIASHGPNAVRQAKAALNEQWLWDEPTAWERQLDIGSEVMVSREAEEGTRAFLEHRPPRWSQPDPD